MRKNLIAIATIFITLVACNTSNKINTDEATTLITEYLEENPLYETGKFNTNKQKLVTNKDKTPFYSFGKDPYPNSNFITQKFKLKYNEKSGWKIIKK